MNIENENESNYENYEKTGIEVNRCLCTTV